MFALRVPSPLSPGEGHTHLSSQERRRGSDDPEERAGTEGAEGSFPDGAKGAQRRILLKGGGGNSLDVVVLISKLFVIKAELIHENGRHLLNLVLGECLRQEEEKR